MLVIGPNKEMNGILGGKAVRPFDLKQSAEHILKTRSAKNECKEDLGGLMTKVIMHKRTLRYHCGR
jgi:hypothetical protein